MSPNNQNPDDYPARTDERQSQQREVWRGVGVAFLLHLIQIPLVVFTAFVLRIFGEISQWAYIILMVIAYSLIFVGISQLVYIIPAIIFYYRDGRRGVVKGLIIAAAITFLLNATCSALVSGN